MKTRWKNLLIRLKNPTLTIKILTILTFILSATLSLLMLLIDYEKTALSIVAYSLFGVAGLSLFYSAYIIIPLIPTIKRKIVSLLQRYDFTYLLLKNFGFRTLVFAIGSFIISLFFATVNGVLGIINRSIWYGALAFYYLALALLRGRILFYHKNRISKKIDGDEITKTILYRNSGITLLILNLGLSTATAQMIFSGAHFSYIGWTVFAYALYAFYKIITSIINLFKAKSHPDLTVKAIRNVNLADAVVSILALQTALLTEYSNGGKGVSVANTLTGSMVTLITVTLGITMIIYSIKRLKLLKGTLNDERKI